MTGKGHHLAVSAARRLLQTLWTEHGPKVWQPTAAQQFIANLPQLACAHFGYRLQIVTDLSYRNDELTAAPSSRVLARIDATNRVIFVLGRLPAPVFRACVFHEIGHIALRHTETVRPVLHREVRGPLNKPVRDAVEEDEAEAFRKVCQIPFRYLRKIHIELYGGEIDVRGRDELVTWLRHRAAEHFRKELRRLTLLDFARVVATNATSGATSIADHLRADPFDVAYALINSGLVFDSERVAKSSIVNGSVMPKGRPRAFVGSSTEALDVANAIHANLQHDAEVTVWDQGVFTPSASALTDLLSAVKRFDFAVFVFAPDDLVRMRQQEYRVARDNVVFETALFLSRIGQKRVFLVAPSDANDLHLPSDLLGIWPLKYDASRSDGNHRAALGPACSQIRQQIRALGSRPGTTAT